MRLVCLVLQSVRVISVAFHRSVRPGEAFGLGGGKLYEKHADKWSMLDWFPLILSSSKFLHILIYIQIQVSHIVCLHIRAVFYVASSIQAITRILFA